MAFLSPLRYPGGKRRLASFVKQVFIKNNLLNGDYVEPYAGGASIALALLFDGFAQNIWINDLDRSVHAFWYSVLNHTEELCRLISDTPVNMDEWVAQKRVQGDLDANILNLGFSTFFLNRTNRSGIISGGVIGGKKQSGEWKLDARFNKEDLISRIKKIASHHQRINLRNKDAISFVQSILPSLPERTLLYLDPPYYIKGQQMLYQSYYSTADHEFLSHFVQALKVRWIVSYDDAPEIRVLYANSRSITYSLHYSAQDRYAGDEVMFFCDNLILDGADIPLSVKSVESVNN